MGDIATKPEVKLYEIVCLVKRACVVAAVSNEDALEAVSTWEQAWEENSDLIGVSDVEVTDIREPKTSDLSDEAHEITAAAHNAMPAQPTGDE